MIIVYNLMVQLGLSENFKHQFHQWDFATLSMKEPIGMIWQTYLTSCEVRKEVVKTLEPFPLGKLLRGWRKSSIVPMQIHTFNR